MSINDNIGCILKNERLELKNNLVSFISKSMIDSICGLVMNLTPCMT